MAVAWAARRDSPRRLPWAWPLLWARLRSATLPAPPVIRVGPRARLGVASAGSATRNRSRSSANKTSCTVAYDMVLTSCGHRLVDFFARPSSGVVRMTGLIAATSPLPESTAFHNGVIQATRGCAARPASGRRNLLPGGVPRCTGVPASARLRQSSSGLGQQHRMGQVTYALREPTSARRSKLPYPAYPSGCHKASQHIPIAGQLGISRRPKSTPFSAADANRPRRQRRVGAG